MEAAEIVDRRRLRRKLSFWRVGAFLALAAALLTAVRLGAGDDAFGTGTAPQVARITIDGFISAPREQIDLIAKLAKNDQVKAVIVAINSSGGSTTGGETLYEALRNLAEAKPTVVTMGTVAASAAYMAALAADHIVARRTTVTGSIGVVFESPEVSGLLDKLGVKMDEIKSAPLKAEPSPFHPASPEARAVIAGVVADTFGWFVDLVAERRKLDRPTALGLADGRVFTGQQALAVKLVDEIGGEDAARAWLTRSKGISGDLPVRDWKPSTRVSLPFGEAAIAWVARQLGLPPGGAEAIGLDRILPKNLWLDGLLSLWQGPLEPAAGAPR
ncbi:MAG: signal peptide peptidase SppA [Bauldia sp.]